MKKYFRNFQTKKLPLIQIIAYCFLILGLIIGVWGFVLHETPSQNASHLYSFIEQFYTNISTDFVSIAITILIIDQISKREAERELKTLLVTKMKSQDNHIACDAAAEIKARNWHSSDLLVEKDFSFANLDGADLSFFNLDKANFSHANLNDTILQSTHLVAANLHHAKLNGANLRHAYLYDANLRDCKLVEAKLITVFASGADFVGADLTRATMIAGNFDHAIFFLEDAAKDPMLYLGLAIGDGYGKEYTKTINGLFGVYAKLEGANMDRIDLAGAQISPLQLKSAIITKRIVMPDETFDDPEVKKRFMN